MRTVLRAVICLAIIGSQPAWAFPDEADWVPVLQGGAAVGDVAGDGSDAGRDLVGDETDPALFVHSDGATFSVRLRVDADPTASGALGAAGWGLLVDVDGDFLDYEYALLVDGDADEIVFAHNTTPGGLGLPGDAAETLLASVPTDSGNVRVLAATSTFGATEDWYVDFAIDQALLEAAGLDEPPLYFIGGTGGARSLDADVTGCDGLLCAIFEAVSDPTRLDGSAVDDTDGDTVPDVAEDVDGSGDPLDDDTDGDGTPDYLDADDDDDGVPTQQEGTGDTDGDGIPNYLDPVEDPPDGDLDNDGIPDLEEDRDGDGDPANDDSDGDGSPDYLDFDDDGDGIPSVVETAEDFDGDGTPNHLDLDSDGDGATDREEGALDHDGDGAPNYLDADDVWRDGDSDGLGDLEEDRDGDGDPANDDTDADGIPDYLDADDDGDGVPTETEGAGDLDGDGIVDYLDPTDDRVPEDEDEDDDGIPDAVEGDADSDEDGIPDYLDPDSDDDGLPDADEGTGDADEDGIPDYLDSANVVAGAGFGCSTSGSPAGIVGVLLGAAAILGRRRPR